MIRWMVNGNYEKKPDFAIAKLYHLDPTFFTKLSMEVLSLICRHTPSYVTDSAHLSYWSRPEGLITQFSLLNSSGRFDDYSVDHNRSIRNKSFRFAHQYPTLAQFISLFPHAVNFRINILNEKSRFTQHQEDICFIHNQTGEPALRARFHLPIATQMDAHMFMQGFLYHFEPGTIYYFNNGCIHDGINASETESRVHLVWDMLMTKDTYERMFARSHPIPELVPIEEIALQPLTQLEIDPNYKQWPRKLTYEQACEITLCPIQ